MAEFFSNLGQIVLMLIVIFLVLTIGLTIIIGSLFLALHIVDWLGGGFLWLR